MKQCHYFQAQVLLMAWSVLGGGFQIGVSSAFAPPLKKPRPPRAQRTLLSALPPVISVENLSCSHNGGETWQLKDVSYVLPRGAKVALVGRNGCGKSTFLRILAENTCLDDLASAGTTATTADFKYTGLVTSPRDVRVAFVEQEPPTPSDTTVADALLGIQSATTAAGSDQSNNNNNKSVYAAVRRYRLAAAKAEWDPGAFARASADMDAVSGWNVLTKADEIATKLRVRHLQDEPLSKISGGERKRVALAAALVQEPDVLLLDEPTNFLSLAGVQWLEDLLADKKLTILMVTHDRAFLDQVCDRVLELDHGQLYEYAGSGFADYLQAKEERLQLEDAALHAAKAKYRLELEWMRRQPQARESKSKARIDAFYKLQKSTKPRPAAANLMLDGGGEQRRIGGKIMSLRHVNLSFGDRVMLNDFSYDFCKGDRICLAGANGVGKTTFVRVLTGEQPINRGDLIVGDTIVLGVYDQLGLVIEKPEQTVLDFVVEGVHSRDDNSAAAAVAPDEARRLLRKFEFPRSRWNERVSVLSGGEKRRLQLLSVLSRRPNFLVLDEPSVDCDVETLQALESFLREEFKGVLLIVSHDRAFADKVTDHLFVFQGDGDIIDFEGTLSEYAATLVEMENDKIQGSGGVTTDDNKTSYKEDSLKRNEQRNNIRRAKKDMDNLERSIEKLREKAATIQKEIDESSDKGWTVLAELTDKLHTAKDEIDEKEMRWMELAEVVEEAEVEV